MSRQHCLKTHGEAEDDAMPVSVEVINDGSGLSSQSIQKKSVARKTWVTVGGKRIDLLKFHADSGLAGQVSYRAFWQRVHGLRLRNMLDEQSLADGLTMLQTEWITFYGGGRRRAVLYVGDAYPEQSGMSFPSLTAFLRAIGRYEDKSIVWSRVKSGWNLDSAVSTPVAFASKRCGLIYKIERIKSGERYVGLTLGTIDQRWGFHLRSSQRGGTTKLARAIRDDGADGFNCAVVEDGITDLDELSRREKFWVEKLGALGPKGLNTAVPGGLGGPGGKRTVVNGEVFRSREEAAQILSQRTGLASHVVLSRLINERPLPNKARKHSRHPEAGSNLFRRWLSLLKRYPDMIESRWIESYDNFKADVFPHDPSANLVRIDDKRPWGSTNFEWMSTQEKVDRHHGKSVVIRGVTFPSLKAVAKHFAIGVSTLKNRIGKQGMTIEYAVEIPLAPTSFKSKGGEILVDGLVFRSQRQAILHIAKTRGLNEHQAKYRFSVGRLD